jgi:RNA polymerase sigma-70 factor (ECF subfamily)
MMTAPNTAGSHHTAFLWLEEHGDALFSFALARIRDPAAAEDLVQETLLAAIGSAGTFNDQSSHRTWLIGILKHKLIDHLRRTLRERPLSGLPADMLADLFDRRGRWKSPPSRWNADPHDLAESAEFQSVLAGCLSRLPVRTAQLFWLREAEGMDTHELCEHLGLSPDNVWTILHRARIGLRKCLGVHWFDGEQCP